MKGEVITELHFQLMNYFLLSTESVKQKVFDLKTIIKNHYVPDKYTSGIKRNGQHNVRRLM